MSIEDYINEGIDEVGGIPDREAQRKKSHNTAKVGVDAKDVNELTRKRDILASVALLDGLESYLGENITAIQIRKMKKEKLESYFLLYQEKAGQETTNEMMSSLVEMSVKGLSFIVNIDNQEDLKNDIVNNKQLRRTLGKQVAEITEKYGDVVACAKLFFTVGKHISFSPTDASINSDSISINTDSTSINSDSISINTDSTSINTDSTSTN